MLDQDDKKKKKRGPGRPKREVVPKVEKEAKKAGVPNKGGRPRGPNKPKTDGVN